MKPVVSITVTIILLLVSMPVFSGMDVSLSEEIEKMQKMEAEIPENSPAYNQLRRLKIELELLLAMPEDRRYGEESRIFNLQQEIYQLDQVLEKEIRNINDDSPQYFSRAKNRVVVFTYDDPDGTGIGDALSFIVSKALLFSAPVTSYGVVNYQGGAEAPDDSGLTYFDKVDKISSREKYLFSVWGRITKDGAKVTIDTFGQIDNELEPYRRELAIPGSMGGGFLQARVNSSRFKIHTMTIANKNIDTFNNASGNIRKLRAEPSMDSETSGFLPEGKAYRILDSQGNWVKLGFKGGESGWTNVREYCAGECKPLLLPVRFINNFIALTSADRQFEIGSDIRQGAINATKQLNALKSIKQAPYQAQAIANDQPDEAGFSSIGALATMAIEIDRLSLEQDFHEIRLDKSFVGNLANNLAEASLSTPRDLDILYNLAVLFNYLGDEKRRDLSYSIAESIELQ